MTALSRLLIGFALAAAGPLSAAEKFDDAVAKASLDYGERLQRATEELSRTRERIAREKAPYLEQLREAEDRIIAAEAATTRTQTDEAGAAEQRRRLVKELDATMKQSAYMATLARETLKTFEDALAPGEDQELGQRLPALREALDRSGGTAVAAPATAVLAWALQRTELALGGFTTPGRALRMENNELVDGSFAFVGPETFFRPTNGVGAGMVRRRTGAKYPLVYPIASWKPAQAQAFFEGKAEGRMVADVSGGKALRLKETTGSVWEHIEKGGAVAFLIVIVGVVATVMVVQKIRDAVRMRVNAPGPAHALLAAVANGSTTDAREALQALRGMPHELFSVGLQYRNRPKAILEEQLQAVLLRQRLQAERRLPLLAVIATSAPLMGLLGTVVGMVKTFALITVFGTGNAAKLSSGISEVLVATELGLVVAIPTLIAHGFLAHRVQKNLGILERYALQFVTAVEAAKADCDPEPEATFPR